MTTPEEHERKGTMSLEEMKGWLSQELQDSEKAHELRTKDAKRLVDDYEAGRITAQQVNERLYEHDKRWGEALNGSASAPGKSDELILAEIDRAQEQFLHPKPFSISTRERERKDNPGEQSR